MALPLIRKRRVKEPAFSERVSPMLPLVGGLPAEPVFNLRGALAEPTPAMDVRDTPKAYLVKVDVPGLKRENLDIHISGSKLSLLGKPALEAKVEEGTSLLRERHHGEFSRSYQFHDEVNVEKVQAELKDGVLNLVLPKSHEARSKKINIAKM